ncbi:Translation factor guf1 mitochondrial [Goodea atripinnis]|uniref:Translation factor guf1 mitochondrial n=1 Tax=Goodea atripinnis TaxID=208336 RepID=A0ABV0Q194_9TELE
MHQQQEHGSEELTIVNPAQFPDKSVVSEYLEPMVLGTILAPETHTGKIMSLCLSRRAVQKNMVYIDDQRVMMKYLFPLNEIVVDFYDLLKSLSSGYARDRAYSTGKAMCERLKESIPRQMFEIAVQAAIGSKVIARET